MVKQKTGELEKLGVAAETAARNELSELEIEAEKADPAMIGSSGLPTVKPE